MFRNVAHSEEWENTTVTIYKIVFLSSPQHLSRDRIPLISSARLWDQMAAQRFEIKWQHGWPHISLGSGRVCGPAHSSCPESLSGDFLYIALLVIGATQRSRY